MLMTTGIYCLGLIFFSALIFAVHGAPTPKSEDYSVTIFDKDTFKPVLKGVKAATRVQMTRMINKLKAKNLQKPSVILYYNTAPEKSGEPTTVDYKQMMMIRFVLQGGTTCDKHPCFGWIQFNGFNIFGSIHSTRTDGGWDRDRYDPEGIGEEQGNSYNTEFVKSKGSWLKEWNEVTWPGVAEWLKVNKPLKSSIPSGIKREGEGKEGQTQQGASKKVKVPPPIESVEQNDTPQDGTKFKFFGSGAFRGSPGSPANYPEQKYISELVHHDKDPFMGHEAKDTHTLTMIPEYPIVQRYLAHLICPVKLDNSL
ncbi:hypothetical protein BDP27DRAFT_1401960 [Rhodocollybia butyracea]|uniref:Uncharacterized protein n=1 Tax=Rhodocollybia butyracea TaxID=206335 RepID=A0A9P5PZ29_9AGAR|nr:hypothetical protein BDP27DRAFT_1401960 [Rhodocollybia butyracea]